MAHSKGNWKLGHHWGTVVTDNGDGFPENKGHDDTGYYGGYLVAESIAKEADAKLISAAPELLEMAKRVLFIFGDESNYPPGTIGYGLSQYSKMAIKKATE